MTSTTNRNRLLADTLAERIRSKPLTFPLDRRGGITTAAISGEIIPLQPKRKPGRKKRNASIHQLDKRP